MKGSEMRIEGPSAEGLSLRMERILGLRMEAQTVISDLRDNARRAEDAGSYIQKAGMRLRGIQRELDECARAAKRKKGRK